MGVVIIEPGTVNTAMYDKGEKEDLSEFTQTEYSEAVQNFLKWIVNEARTNGLAPESRTPSAARQFKRRQERRITLRISAVRTPGGDSARPYRIAHRAKSCQAALGPITPFSNSNHARIVSAPHKETGWTRPRETRS